MTQPPRNGPSAPADAGSDAGGRGRDAAGQPNGGHPNGPQGGSPGWGATSTMDGTPYGRSDDAHTGPTGSANGGGLGAATAPPRREDSPTANVPLVQGSRAPGGPTARPAGAGEPQGPPASGRNRQAPNGEKSTHAARGGARARGPRRARLQLRHIDPWTVLKFSCVLSIALFFVWLIVIGVLFGVLDGAGVIEKINNGVTQINGAGSKPPITAGIVFGGAAIIGVVNIVLFIALSTIGSVVYNLCADLVGGIEVTLSER